MSILIPRIGMNIQVNSLDGLLYMLYGCFCSVSWPQGGGGGGGVPELLGTAKTIVSIGLCSNDLYRMITDH